MTNQPDGLRRAVRIVAILNLAYFGIEHFSAMPEINYEEAPA